MENLTDSQCNALCNWYIASVEDAVARRVLAIRQGHWEEGHHREASPRETGDEGADPPQMSGDANQEGCGLVNL